MNKTIQLSHPVPGGEIEFYRVMVLRVNRVEGEANFLDLLRSEET